MYQKDTFLSYSPNRLLDALLEWMNLSSDRKLARKLGVSLHVIKSIRTGRQGLGASLLLQMAECAGRSINELRLVLGDRRSKIRLSCKTFAA
jgi:hypothetical protein